MKDNTPSGPERSVEEMAKDNLKEFYNYLQNDRLFFVDEARKWLIQFNKAEISFSKFVEMFNEKVFNRYHAAASKGKEEEIEVRVPKLWPPDKQGWYWCVVQGRPKALGMKLVKLEYGEDDLGNVGFLQEDDDFIVLYYLTSGIKDNPPAPQPKDTLGMQWVKASERLPEINKVVHIKIKDGLNIGQWDGEDFWPFYDWLHNENGAKLDKTVWLDEATPLKEGEEDAVTRDRETIYTYYQVDFSYCSAFDGDYMICESIEQIAELIKLVDINLDDPEVKATVEIKGIPMTPAEYETWLKENDTSF